jgi:hypothetical protein
LTPAHKQSGKRNGKLRIPLPFEDALRAATETKPPETKRKKKRPAKKH